jgi:hypothetical protein
MSFSQSVIENLESYVYFLRDPRNGETFYVGKGKGNRIFQHVECALGDPKESDKLDRIREIVSSGKQVEHLILRHGITEEMAFEVEVALIDYLGLDKLSNEQSGHHSSDFGLKTTDEIKMIYEAKPLNPQHPLIIININKLFRRDMDSDQLYQSTRSAWVVGQKREKAKYALASYRGLVREVYKIEKWVQVSEKRWEFEGVVASDEVRNTYLHRSLSNYLKKGAANPIRYINC